MMPPAWYLILTVQQRLCSVRRGGGGGRSTTKTQNIFNILFFSKSYLVTFILMQSKHNSTRKWKKGREVNIAVSMDNGRKQETHPWPSWPGWPSWPSWPSWLSWPGANKSCKILHFVQRMGWGPLYFILWFHGACDSNNFHASHSPLGRSLSVKLNSQVTSDILAHGLWVTKEKFEKKQCIICIFDILLNSFDCSKENQKCNRLL